MDDSKPLDSGEAIGNWAYFRQPDGDLYRRPRGTTPQSHPGKLFAPAAGAAFALRLARIDAGLPELGG
jgi:hypothetical protein